MTNAQTIEQAAGMLKVRIRNIDSLQWLQSPAEFAQAQDRKAELRADYALLVAQHSK